MWCRQESTVAINAIASHASSNEIGDDNQFIVTNWNKQHHKITARLSLAVEWKDGFTFYEKLPDIKEALPIRIAEYSICMEGTLCFEK